MELNKTKQQTKNPASYTHNITVVLAIAAGIRVNHSLITMEWYCQGDRFLGNKVQEGHTFVLTVMFEIISGIYWSYS